MKRDRDESSPAESVALEVSAEPTRTFSSSSSPYALHFEVIYGITSRRSSPLEAERAAVLSRLLGTSSTTSASEVAALLSPELSACLGGGTRELVYHQLLRSGDENSLLRLRTVELIANDGRTLVLATRDGEDRNDAPSLMDVAGVESRTSPVAYPADLLLLRCQPRRSVTSDEEESSVSAMTAPTSAWATHATFLTYHTAHLTAQDVDLWKEAAEGSMTVVVRWLADLLEQPPGLGQLAFLEVSAAATADHGGAEGWRRALQLPLLLRLKPEVMQGADAATLSRLRRTIAFTLRTLVHAFVNVESAMRLPHLCRRLAYLFLASPLFVDGASQVSVQLAAAESVGVNRVVMAQTLHACLRLGLQHASATVAVVTDMATGTEELRRSAEQARNGFEVALSRLSHAWLVHAAQLKSKRATGNSSTTGEVAVCEVLESVAGTGVLREVVRWLQLEDDLRRAQDRTDSGLVDALTALLTPPSLAQLQEGRHLQERTVAEQLTALRRTYNPYMSHDVPQFLRSTAIAAYAELYGNTARAVRRVTKVVEGAPELQTLGRLGGVVAVPLEAVEAVGVRSTGLSAYSLTEVQQHAAFGLPVQLRLRQQTGHQQEQLNTVDTLLRATRGSTEASGRTTDASLFAYAMVLLNGQWIVFPLVLTQLQRDPTRSETRKRRPAGPAHVVAHVLQDGDMLADFVSTSAATAEDGMAQAWVVVGEEATVQRRAHRRRHGAATASASMAESAQERLLPSGTPALTYMDCLRRLCALAHTVRQCEAGSSNKARPGTTTTSTTTPPTSNAIGKPFDEHAATGLWTEHFLSGAVPLQRYVPALASSVAALLAGTSNSTGPATSPSASSPPAAGAAATTLQTLLASVNATVTFSPAQAEALYSLTAGGGLGAPSHHHASLGPPTRPGAPPAVPASVRVVDGCTGSGKTSVLYAAGLVRGKLHAAARQEQQRNLQTRLRQKMAAVKQAAAALRSATVDNFFAPSDVAKSDRSLLDEAATAAAEARQQFELLNEGFLYCSTPFLLRPAAATSTVPAAVTQLLCERTGTPAETPLWSCAEVNSLAVLLAESHERSLKAPLTAQLNGELQLLRRTGLWSGRGRDTDVLAAPLLSLTMAAREAAEAMTHANTDSGVTGHTWSSYISSDYWPEEAVGGGLPFTDANREEEEETSTEESEGKWEVLTTAPVEAFDPVAPPSTTHLTSLSAEQRGGWHSVYLDKQAELSHHIHTAVHASVKTVFQYFLDLTHGVAAASQSTRHTLLTATPVELTQGMQLPYLWSWQPAHVCIDDLDSMQDGIFAMLTPACSVVYSLTAEVPAFQERRRAQERLVLAILRSLRGELQRVGAITTTALRESLRCGRVEVQAALQCTIADARLLASAAEKATAEEDEKDKESKEKAELSSSHVLDLAAPPPAFPGLASYSAVEVWSHAVSMDHCAAADAASAVFLMNHLSSYYGNGSRDATPLSFGVYTNSASSAELVSEAIAVSALAAYTGAIRVWKESLEDTGNETSFAAATGATAVAYTSLEEAESETDVGLVCLSGLLEVVMSTLKGNSSSHRPDVRQQQWRQLWTEEAADGSPSLFVTRLQWWLWRLLRRVRHGVIFIGSRELFSCVPLFARMEALVRTQRRLLAPHDQRAYWLPVEVGASVLALVCPDHYKCRRTATVHEQEEEEEADLGATAEEAAEAVVVEVRTNGPESCVSLCLKPYRNCRNHYHACLEPCHVQHYVGEEEEQECRDDATLHACCPYPCGAVLSCGHRCHRICGIPCEPCTYAGLRELPCGQRVVSGMDTNKVLQYAFFHHFQERRCGEVTAPCVSPVSVACTRCGARTRVTCHCVAAQQQRQYRSTVAEGEEAPPTLSPEEAAAIPYVLQETACAGCVALYNKVATKFGYELLPVPPTDRTTPTSEHAGAEEELEEDSVGTAFPRHTLSAEAQAELKHEFTIAGKKVELLVMKEALEISSDRATEKADYVVHRATYERLKTMELAQQRAWENAFKAELDSWAVRLRKALGTQYGVNTELDTLMPRLVSDATDEDEVQRLQFV